MEGGITMSKTYKCPYCTERYDKYKLIYHIEEKHEELIPEKQTPTQVVFNYINKKDPVMDYILNN